MANTRQRQRQRQRQKTKKTKKTGNNRNKKNTCGCTKKFNLKKLLKFLKLQRGGG